MTYRSKLFATVAMPWLALSVAVPPAMAENLMRSFEVAQAEEQPAEGGPSQEELLLLQQQEEAKRQAEQQAAEEEAKRQAEQQAAEEQQRQAAEEEAKRQAEQQAAEEQQRQAAEEEAKRQAEQQAAEEQQRQAAEEEAKRQAEQQAAEEQQRQAAEQEAQRQAEQQAAEEQQRQAAEEEAKRQAEQQAAEEQQRQAAEEAQQQQQQQTADPCAVPEGAERPADCPVPAPAPDQAQQPSTPDQGQPPVTDQAEQPADPAQQPPADQAQQPAEQPPVTDQAQQPADPAQQPPAEQQAEQPAAQPVEPVVDNQSEEQKQQIAADPASTNETIVLPVENGAAVLDSDKDADLQGGQAAREQRRALRQEIQAQEQAPPPTTDADAQAALVQEGQTVDPATVKARLTEEGTRVQEAPQFAVPQTTNIVNNTIINNTVINNTTNNTEVNNTTNNTVVNNNNNNTVINNEVTQVRVEQQIDNRTVLAVGDRIIVRGDERPRLRRDAEEVYYDELSRGRTRETIVRENGVQIVTVYNRYGDVIQRSRIGRDGEEYLLVYAPEADEGPRRPQLVDVGYELPPMRLRIPVRDYIVDYSEEPDRDYYEFLSEPPVERVERVYTIDEVRTSARLRDKVRRIDLDTITFATGSAEVSMTQAKTMRKVADAMNQILEKDPGETFFIEGHTDAVGSDQSNLILSDKRAESVAVLLTEVYGIPPENLVTQGYGERFLKVRTQSAEQQNRRVTIRRVTPLVRPVAQAN
ncbi:Outer membrane protein OmpA [Rhizobium sp. RU20A]|uniref:OmpA family protein n=1 Tax=Rhizobium sp. RU20A TaxID=1907412 RepID=UPI000955DFC0|nr:OmpA family protein [Rhizobium sp. RU20A]SIQ14130.1 Outer membrane protein OmpA [Rhizobium sp. RU20A]